MSRISQSRFSVRIAGGILPYFGRSCAALSVLILPLVFFFQCVKVECLSEDPACEPVLALLRPGSGLTGVTPNPNYSRFLFTVTSGDDQVRAFSIDYSTGTLSQVSSVGVGSGSSLFMSRHPSRPILLVPENNPSDGVRSFTYDAATGALAAVNNQTTGNANSHRVWTMPSGDNILFSSVQGGATYYFYATLDSAGNIGVPVLKNSILPANCQALNLHPTGSYFYTDHCPTGGIHQFSIDSSGNIGDLGSITYNGTDSIDGVAAFDPAGHMFVLSYNGQLASFDVNTATGALTTISNFATGLGGAYTVAVHPSGNRLYATFASPGQVQEYAIASNGALTLTRQAAVLPVGQQYERSCFDAAGKFLFVARYNFSGAIQTVLIDDDGTMSAGPLIASGDTITRCVTTSDVR